MGFADGASGALGPGFVEGALAGAVGPGDPGFADGASAAVGPLLVLGATTMLVALGGPKPCVAPFGGAVAIVFA